MTNLIAATRRLPCPQIAMRKYIGISIASQNTKNRNRSKATKTPMAPASVHRMQKWKKPVRCSISRQEAPTAISPRIAVNVTMTRPSPSAARWKSIPNRGIQAAERSEIQIGSPVAGA